MGARLIAGSPRAIVGRRVTGERRRNARFPLTRKGAEMPKEKHGVEVRTHKGNHFINMEDLLNHPSFVRDELLPKYGRLYVTRFHKVVLEVRQPDLSELGYEIREY